MPKLPSLPAVYLAAGIGALGLLYWLTRKGAAEALARGAAGAVGGLVVGGIKGANDAAGEVVQGVGEMVGIPRTDADQCTIDLARGDLVAASFSCPAKRWVNVAVFQNKDEQAEALKTSRGGYIINPRERN